MKSSITVGNSNWDSNQIHVQSSDLKSATSEGQESFFSSYSAISILIRPYRIEWINLRECCYVNLQPQHFDKREGIPRHSISGREEAGDPSEC
jgi:hypothetical protein